MSAVNVTVRVDEDTKKQFDSFCENVGINVTTAINMFIRATLRTRELPFPVTDAETKRQTRQEFCDAIKAAQEQSVINGTDKMTMEEIDEIIAESRRERQAKQA